MVYFLNSVKSNVDSSVLNSCRSKSNHRLTKLLINIMFIQLFMRARSEFFINNLQNLLY